MQAMSIDMDEESMPSNSSTNLGTRDLCRRVNENNTLDADEDVIDGLNIDITAKGIPPHHDSGTPGSYADDTGGVQTYGYTLNFPAAAAHLLVSSFEFDNPAVNILARNPGSSVQSLHQILSGHFLGIAADPDLDSFESGDGVLDRLTLSTKPAALPGIYALTLTGGQHTGPGGGGQLANQYNNAEIAVDTQCTDSDGDGVGDAIDECPQLAGPVSNNGCPLPGAPAVGGTVGLLAEGESAPADRESGSRIVWWFGGPFGAIALAAGAGVAWRLTTSRRWS
jgi:hypothetical protein